MKNKFKKLDEEISRACNSVGMPRNSLKRLAMVEFLENHFNKKIKAKSQLVQGEDLAVAVTQHET